MFDFKLNWSCTYPWQVSTSVTYVVSSNQAFPRHMKVPTYRCFLPNLTELERYLLHSTWAHQKSLSIINNEFVKQTLKDLKTRREGDSNPRCLLGTHAFQACTLNHSDTSPNKFKKQKWSQKLTNKYSASRYNIQVYRDQTSIFPR